ncbi:hypothetical protein Mgra_00007718 [Meloidogyne graminicola]|uniref:Uncharacterized protein n=1 Tax=Meloidogyne graminicola TaxID=189291 RepID=A0A8S9ZHW1_9BILA|nr:hypothetical protein Mgra_00007718 [Meloidogyne graminicola]
MSKSLILLFFTILLTTHALKHRIWDPLLHGITPEAKRDYDEAIAKGNVQKAEQIRHRIGHEIINAFWAGVHVSQLHPIIKEWDLGFSSMKK